MGNLSSYSEPSNGLWVFRFIQFLVAFITLIVAGTEASSWKSATAADTGDGVGCKIPSPLGWNIACAILTWPVLIYLFFSSGVKSWARKLPWSIVAQLTLDVLFWFLWLITAATAHYTCTELCDACSAYNPANVWGWGISCGCGTSSRRAVADFLVPRGGLTTTNAAKGSLLLWKLLMKIGLDAVMVILFSLSMVGSGLMLHHARKKRMQHDGDGSTEIEHQSYQPKYDMPFNGGGGGGGDTQYHPLSEVQNAHLEPMRDQTYSAYTGQPYLRRDDGY